MNKEQTSYFDRGFSSGYFVGLAWGAMLIMGTLFFMHHFHVLYCLRAP